MRPTHGIYFSISLVIYNFRVDGKQIADRMENVKPFKKFKYVALGCKVLKFSYRVVQVITNKTDRVKLLFYKHYIICNYSTILY